MAGVFTAFGALLTAASIFLGVLPAFVKMRREVREDRIEAARVAAAAAESATQITAQLGVIHTLTNATLSAAYEATLAATKREETMMREVGRLMMENGQEPSADWRAALEAIQQRIAELTLAVQDRQTQTMAANMQIAVEEKRVAQKEEASS